MTAQIDYGEILLAAARQARDIGSYIATFPQDPAAVEPLRTVATRIADAARAIGDRELIERSKKLYHTAHGIIRTERGIDRLNSEITEFLGYVEEFVQR